MLIDLSIKNLVELTSSLINIYQSNLSDTEKVENLKSLFLDNQNMDDIKFESTSLSKNIAISIFILDTKSLLLYFLNKFLDFSYTNGTDNLDLIRLNFQQEWESFVSLIQKELINNIKNEFF